MAITGTRLLINLRYTYLGQKCQNGQIYTPGGAAFITANCDAVGEAWWNDVKDLWRAMVADQPTVFRFDSVIVEELDGSLGLGEVAIPTGERDGTRDLDEGDTIMPSYCAVGMRLTVPTRLTRPGQKRIPGVYESDVLGNDLSATVLGLVEDLSRVYDTTITLGAPVALGTLTPKIVHFPTVEHPTETEQDVAGHVINAKITTQVSRRFGHGT